MLIYLAYLWAFLYAILLPIIFKRGVAWWERFLGFAVITVCVFGFKFIGETTVTSDLEFHGAKAVKIEHFEDWDERVPCRHEIRCTHEVACTHIDKDGRPEHSSDGYEHSNDGYEHPYDVDYHPDIWNVEDSTGKTHNVSAAYFNRVAAFWKNKTKVDLNRDYHSIDGDMFYSTFPNKRDLLVPIITTHRYENRVQASNSSFKFRAVSPQEKADKGIFDYPRPDGDMNCETILGNVGRQKLVGEREFSYLNAEYGPRYQVRIWVVVFKNKPLDNGYVQQAYWQGGNKNEFVITIGTDSNGNITWCYPFCWKPDEAASRDRMNMLTIQTRDWVQAQIGKPLDVVRLANYLEKEIPQNWRRKQFKEFNYLSVEPPLWAVIATHIVGILLCCGVAYWAVTNKHE